MNIKLKYWFEWTNQGYWRDFAILINYEWIKLDSWNPALQVQKGKLSDPKTSTPQLHKAESSVCDSKEGIFSIPMCSNTYNYDIKDRMDNMRSI